MSSHWVQTILVLVANQAMCSSSPVSLWSRVPSWRHGVGTVPGKGPAWVRCHCGMWETLYPRSLFPLCLAAVMLIAVTLSPVRSPCSPSRESSRLSYPSSSIYKELSRSASHLLSQLLPRSPLERPFLPVISLRQDKIERMELSRSHTAYVQEMCQQHPWRSLQAEGASQCPQAAVGGAGHQRSGTERLSVAPEPSRIANHGGPYQRIEATGRESVWAGGILVPVCGMELLGYHQKSEGLHPDCL